MPTLFETALASLDSDDPEPGIGLAASFFDHSLGNRIGLDWPEVLDQPVTVEELRRLRDRLIALVRSGTPAPVAGAAVFALGKLYDSDLEPFFVEVLRAYLERDAGVLYQAMIALDNLGLPVFAGREAMSWDDVDQNRALAAAFLKSKEMGETA